MTMQRVDVNKLFNEKFNYKESTEYSLEEI